jgi:hypothetical protein
MVNAWLAVTVNVDAGKVAEESPAPIMVDAGTVAEAVTLDAAEIKAPPVGADPDKVTVQVLAVPPWTEAGLQLTEDKLGPVEAPGTVIVPPLPTTVSEVPDGSTLVRLVKEIAAVDLTAVKVKEATTPLEMIVEFVPDATQVKDPATPVHKSDFPPADTTGPAVAFNDEAAGTG